MVGSTHPFNSITDEGLLQEDGSGPIDTYRKGSVYFNGRSPNTSAYNRLDGEGTAGVAALAYGVHTVHIHGGSFNVAGVQNQPAPAAEVHIPFALHQIANFRDIQIATLGKASPHTGDWIYVWKEYCIWLNREGHIRILWGSGMREPALLLVSLAFQPNLSPQPVRVKPS
jgi:hypothetical protein